MSELAAFPNGKYKDQVDSMTQALFGVDKIPYGLRHCSRYNGKLGRVLFPPDDFLFAESSGGDCILENVKAAGPPVAEPAVRHIILSEA